MTLGESSPTNPALTSQLPMRASRRPVRRTRSSSGSCRTLELATACRRVSTPMHGARTYCELLNVNALSRRCQGSVKDLLQGRLEMGSGHRRGEKEIWARRNGSVDSVRDCRQRMYTAVSWRVAVKSSFSWPLGFAGFHNAFVSMCRESHRWLMNKRVYSRISPDDRRIEGLQRQFAGSRGQENGCRRHVLPCNVGSNGSRSHIDSVPSARWVYSRDYTSTSVGKPGI